MLKLLRALLIVSTVPLAGCGSGGGFGDYGLILQTMRKGFSQSFSSNSITRDQAAAIPYASMGYRIDGGREAIVILATDTNGELLWTSESHTVFVTRDGRLKRTVGLVHDLGGQTMQGQGEIPAPAAALKGAIHYRREEDFPNVGLYNITLNCGLAAAGPQTISILQHPIATILVTESCSAAAQGWSFTDRFWVDPENGFTWRSQQHASPNGGTVEMEIFRPPG